MGVIKPSLLKLKASLHQYGLFLTLRKMMESPLLIFKLVRSNNLASAEERFDFIYRNNIWGDSESKSGPGSTLEYTSNLRKLLPSIFEKYEIKKIFDAPCGDFNWMKVFLRDHNIEYLGGDIVKSLIDSHNLNFESSNTTFVHINLITDQIPKTDLMLCRDCLFHLSFSDTKSLLINFLKSETPWLLTTTHINLGNEFVNVDIETGEVRLIDLFSEPYKFTEDCFEKIEDWLPPDPKRVMCLWSREQVVKVVENFEIIEK